MFFIFLRKNVKFFSFFRRPPFFPLETRRFIGYNTRVYAIFWRAITMTFGRI